MLSAAPTADEERRLAILRRMGILDSGREDTFDGLVESAAQLLDMPIALVSLVDEHRQWFKAAVGLVASETPREVAFCAHAIHGSELFEVEDATLDARFADNPLVTGEPRVRFYAGQPLTVGGANLGTLCVIDHRPRRLDPRQRLVLKRLAAAAAELLASRQHLVNLHDEEQRLADFARVSGDWLWETDAQLRYTYVAGDIAMATGQTGAELIGQAMVDAVLIDEHGHPQPGGWRRLLERRVAFARALTEQQVDGRLVHVSYSALPLWGTDSSFLGWRGSARDVSSRRQSDLWARQEELLVQRITAQVPGVLFRARRRDDGLPQFLYLSPAAETLFGFSAEAACANPLMVPSRVHREDAAALLAQLAAATRDLTPWTSEYRMVLPGKRIRWVETRALPEVTDEGVIWNGYTADITERKRVELALRQFEQTWELAADADNLGVAQFDLRSGQLTLDRHACANHGLSYPQPDYSFDQWLASIESEDRAPAQAAMQQAIQSRSRAMALVHVRLPETGLRSIELVVVASRDAAGAATALVGTCRDVTERRTLERLQREKDAAESANRAKSEFLSHVSHELRTPLNSILGFTQLLSLDTEHPLHPEQQRQMAIVQHAGRHLLGQIDALLDLSRIESRQAALNLRSVDLGAALDRCLELIAPQAQRAGVALPAASPGAVHVRADTRALEQVLMNLLSNAIKYNRRGGQIEFGLQAGSEWVALSVSDQGLGMTDAQRQRLFVPFERLGAERRPVQGSGLGLVIVRELIRAMGGALDVASTPGAGSTFTLTLQASEAELATAAGELDALRLEPADTTTDARQRHLLYIEDEPLNVLLMEEVVRRVPPWTMSVAPDGTQGLRAAREPKLDLLLIDINLPDMTGIDVVQALRADPSTARLRCIALSADAMQDQIDVALAAGFDDYWLKPIDVPWLIQQLARLTPRVSVNI